MIMFVHAHATVLQHKDWLISVEGDEEEVQNRLGKYAGSAQRVLPQDPRPDITGGSGDIILSPSTFLRLQLLFT